MCTECFTLKVPRDWDGAILPKILMVMVFAQKVEGPVHSVELKPKLLLLRIKL